jgi:hypothetical protein
MLIPDIASAEKWKMFLRGDVGRALGYCERVLGLYNSIRMRIGDEKIKKMVVGIIGRDTIGHWKDIQSVYEEFFGVRCIGCEEAVKSIAMGIPYSVALQSVSLRLENSSYMKEVEGLVILLSKVLRESSVYIERSDVLKELERDLSTLLNNPLAITRIVKSFYESLRLLLPLYNRFTFFITISRSITKNLLERFFKNLDFKMLSKFNIRFRKEMICRNTAVFMQDKDSLGELILFLTNSIYRFLKNSKGMRRFVSVGNEEEKFVNEMLKLVPQMYHDMGYSEDCSLYSALYKSAITTLVRGNFIHISSRIRIDRERDVALIHNYTIKCENFINMLEPYIVTGLAYFNNITKHNSKTELLLYIYLNQNNIKT